MSIELILEQVKSATDWQTNKQLSRKRVQTDLLLPYSGGLFKITPELIAFLNSWDSETIYLEDSYENPIKINRVELLSMAKDHYQRVMNRWHQDYEELRRIRKV
jgi:hypothetical protein